METPVTVYYQRLSYEPPGLSKLRTKLHKLMSTISFIGKITPEVIDIVADALPNTTKEHYVVTRWEGHDIIPLCIRDDFKFSCPNIAIISNNLKLVMQMDGVIRIKSDNKNHIYYNENKQIQCVTTVQSDGGHIAYKIINNEIKYIHYTDKEKYEFSIEEKGAGCYNLRTYIVGEGIGDAIVSMMKYMKETDARNICNINYTNSCDTLPFIISVPYQTKLDFTDKNILMAALFIKPEIQKSYDIKYDGQVLYEFDADGEYIRDFVVKNGEIVEETVYIKGFDICKSISDCKIHSFHCGNKSAINYVYNKSDKKLKYICSCNRMKKETDITVEGENKISIIGDDINVENIGYALGGNPPEKFKLFKYITE